MSNTSGYLPSLLGPVEMQADGTAQTPRPAINFIGFDAADNTTYDRLDLTPSASTTGAAGSMSAADKTKLDGIQKQGVSSAITAYEIDWSLAGVYTKTLDAGAQVFTFANATDGQVIVVVVTGAVSSVTWPTVQWAGGVAPTQTASGTDVYTFVKAGSTIYGSAAQDMS